MISDNDKKSSFSAGSNIQLNGQSPCSTGVSTVAQTQTLQDKENLVTDHPDEYIIRQWKRRAEHGRRLNQTRILKTLKQSSIQHLQVSKTNRILLTNLTFSVI
jgi:hypothetical protein